MFNNAIVNNRDDEMSTYFKDYWTKEIKFRVNASETELVLFTRKCKSVSFKLPIAL